MNQTRQAVCPYARSLCTARVRNWPTNRAVLAVLPVFTCCEVDNSSSVAYFKGQSVGGGNISVGHVLYDTHN